MSSAADRFHNLSVLFHLSRALGGRQPQLLHDQGKVDSERLSSRNPASRGGIAELRFGRRQFFRSQGSEFVHIGSLARAPMTHFSDGQMKKQVVRIRLSLAVLAGTDSHSGSLAEIHALSSRD